jgi:hypothetical protein
VVAELFQADTRRIATTKLGYDAIHQFANAKIIRRDTIKDIRNAWQTLHVIEAVKASILK